MSDSPTVTDLRALVEQMRALSEKATPGPWFTAKRGEPIQGPTFFLDHPGSEADLTFIAACREGVPALLDALAGAEKARDNWYQKYTVQLQAHEYSERGAKVAEARLARLQELGRQVVESYGKMETAIVDHVVTSQYGKGDEWKRAEALDDALDAFKAEILDSR